VYLLSTMTSRTSRILRPIHPRGGTGGFVTPYVINMSSVYHRGGCVKRFSQIQNKLSTRGKSASVLWFQKYGDTVSIIRKNIYLSSNGHPQSFIMPSSTSVPFSRCSSQTSACPLDPIAKPYSPIRLVPTEAKFC
jgi:hypothetical protein